MSAFRKLGSLVVVGLVFVAYEVAWNTWWGFILFVISVCLIGWVKTRSVKRAMVESGSEGKTFDDADDLTDGTSESVVPQGEAKRLLGGKSVLALWIWGELEMAELPSGEMGVKVSSIHRELEWRERSTLGSRSRRAITGLLGFV